MVPVLSIAMVSILPTASSDLPDLIITPLIAAIPMPETMTIGVAITKAHGHATTITTKPFLNHV